MASRNTNNSNHRDTGATSTSPADTSQTRSDDSHSPRIKDSQVKSIMVFRNGDLTTRPRRIVFNKRQVRTWESFLEQLTSSLKPERAAIRSVMTPRNGTRVKSFDELNPMAFYVAVPNGEKVKRLDYLSTNDVHTIRRRNNPNGVRLEPIKPVVHSKLKVESRLPDDFGRTTKFIRVYRNGDEFTNSIGILLTKRYQQSMESLMKALELKVVLPCNKPIRKVYHMTGQRVKSIREIEDTKHYVVASKEAFMDVNYGQLMPVLHAGKINEDNPQQQSQRDKEQLQKSKEKKLKKDKAAAKIQAGFRGYQTRKDLKNNIKPKSITAFKEEQKQMDKEKAATTIQATFRGHKARVDLAKTQTKPKNQKPAGDKSKERQGASKGDRKSLTEEEAATSIQAAYRGYNTRQKIGSAKQTKESAAPAKKKDDKAAPKKTAQPASKAARDKAQEGKKDADQAATVIQAGFRGFKKREELESQGKLPPSTVAKKKPVQSSKTNAKKAADPKKAADKKKEPIKQDNQKKDKKMEPNDAATKIQSSFRGFQTRQKLEDEKKQKNEAAVKIQSNIRGYQTRKKLGAK